MQELKQKGLLKERLNAARTIQALIASSSLSNNQASSLLSNNGANGNSKAQGFKHPNFSSISAALKLCPNVIEENTINQEFKSKLNIWNRQKFVDLNI